MKSYLIAAVSGLSLIAAASFTQAADKPTDPQIAHIAYTAGQIDVVAAEQAIKKSTNADIIAFARRQRIPCLGKKGPGSSL